MSLRKKSLMSKGLAFCLMSSGAAVESPAVSWDGLVSVTGDELLSSPLVGPFCPTEINEHYQISEKTYFSP